MRVTPTTKPVMVDGATECHVTPIGVAGRMFDYLCAPGNAVVLEPSAGTGNLIAGMIDSVEQVHAIERHVSLCDSLRDRFPDAVEMVLTQADFIEWSETAGKYSYILMNPPFKHIKKHMNAALSILDGRLIALVPITYQHPDAETLEELGPDTFPTAKVHTKIIEINSV